MIQRWLAAPPPVCPPDLLPPPPRAGVLRVLHVITAFEAGAGGNTLLSATGMDRSRYDVWIAGDADGPLWERAEAEGVRTVRLRGFRKEPAPADDLRVLITLIRLMRRHRFDIVHVHSAKAGVLGRLAAWLCQVPVVVCTIHGRDPWWNDPDAQPYLRDLMSPLRRFLFRRVERSMCRMTDAFVAVAPTVARDAVRAGIAPPGRISVAPSAVDTHALAGAADAGRRAAVRRALDIPDGAPLIGTVGRIGAQKNPLGFVRMAHEVGRHVPAARFVMVGEGELAGETAALARSLDVPLVLTGYRPDATEIIAALDVYVVPSLYEGVGRSVTEALAAGRPVVATAVDGVVDLVSHGRTGLLVPPQDVTALAEAVRWMLDHPTSAAEMGRQGSEFVHELFSRARMCAMLDEVYQSQLGTPAETDRRTGAEPRLSYAGPVPQPALRARAS